MLSPRSKSLRQTVLERPAKNGLLAKPIELDVEMGRDLRDRVDQIAVQEGDARLHGVGHLDAISEGG